MKIFSKAPPKFWSMRADRPGRIFMNAIVSGLAAFIFSLAIPDTELGRVAFALMFAIFAVGADLRDRCTQLYHQQLELLNRPATLVVSQEEFNDAHAARARPARHA